MPNVGSICVISPNAGLPSASSKRTGTLPTFRSSTTSRALLSPRSANAVPSVGCPANGNSSCTVKIRTLTPCSCSISFSRGMTNVVSERFISLATACISASFSPRPSKNTASELPSRGLDEKTSHCAIANRRFVVAMNTPIMFQKDWSRCIESMKNVRSTMQKNPVFSTFDPAMRLTGQLQTSILTICFVPVQPLPCVVVARLRSAVRDIGIRSSLTHPASGWVLIFCFSNNEISANKKLE